MDEATSLTHAMVWRIIRTLLKKAIVTTSYFTQGILHDAKDNNLINSYGPMLVGHEFDEISFIREHVFTGGVAIRGIYPVDRNGGIHSCLVVTKVNRNDKLFESIGAHCSVRESCQ